LAIFKTKTMRYLVCDNSENRPFFTEWFNLENFTEETDMIIFDLLLKKYTIDGKHWEQIEEDRL
jgi:hypothetical protein